MVYNIKISCIKTNLKLVRDFLTQVLGKYISSESDINLLLVAVDEICANLIIHSHHCNPNEFIEVKCQPKEDGEFFFEIWDTNHSPFDLNRYSVPEMEQIIQGKKGGGIGLILVKRIVDQINFERVGSQNVCKMSKKVQIKSHKNNE